MLKRTTKITSLLIAAASIVSMVPAIAAADVKKIDGVEGTIYDAVSKGGGVFIVDGEINGEDEAIYYIKDGKYTKLENAQPGDAIGDIYDGKYLEMADGDYYVDVTTGETTDEDIKGNEIDDAASAVRKAIKNDNDGRFNKDFCDDSQVADTTVRNDGGTVPYMWGITGNWSQYFYELKNSFSSSDGYTKTTSVIYSDPKGNYVDVDYNLGKVGVNSTTYGAVTIENTEDTYESKVGNVTYEIKAQIVNDITWDEGPEYIVRSAKLSVFARNKTNNGDCKNITDEVDFGSKSKNYGQVITGTSGNKYIEVLQRISKAQASDEIDGIKYAKDVKTYFITDEDGNHQPLLGLKDGDSSEHVYNGIGLHAITGGTQGYNVSFYYDYINSKVYGETLNYKSSNGYNYIDVDSYDDTDVESNGFKLGCGDVWVLDAGYVKRFNDKNNEFEKLYKVDGGMTNLHCSLPTDAIVWNKDDETYSIIAPSTSAADTTDANNNAATITTSAAASYSKNGWSKASDGAWNYVKSDGTKSTGWISDNGTWYYLNELGTMQTGWINDNGTWYYCNESGAMLFDTTIDGYVLGSNGAWIK